MATRSPKDPTGAFHSALRALDVEKAARKLAAHPELLDGGELARAQTAVAALGTPLLVAAGTLTGWQWLEDQGFAFPTAPGEGFDKVMAHVLESSPVNVIDAWRARSQGTPVPTKLLTAAIARHDTTALAWWAREGLSVEENPVRWGALPWVLFALSKHKLAASAHVISLLDQGVRPLAKQVPDEPAIKLDTPLLWLARHYQAEEKSHATATSEEIERDTRAFRTLWLALVKAGDDPAYRSSLNECPEDILRQTAAAPWWDSHLRQEQALQTPPAARPVRPRRLRS